MKSHFRESGNQISGKWKSSYGAVADTPKGATASAAIYSIIETAKANGLNVYTYLDFLLMWMPDTDWHNHPEDLEDLMPWSEMAQSICKA